MQGHALDDGVFIRSMATRGHQGGLALAAPGDPLLLIYEKLEPVLALLADLGAERRAGALARWQEPRTNRPRSVCRLRRPLTKSPAPCTR